MRYELFISLRYLLGKRKEKFISIISLISVLGVAVGVTALIVVIAVMSGFDNDLQEKIVGTNSHILVEKDGGLADHENIVEKVEAANGVVAASPFVAGQAMLRFRNEAIGVMLRGIDPQGEKKTTRIAEFVKEGGLEFGEDGIIIGSELSARIGAYLGDVVTVVTAAAARPTKLRVCGIFSSGMYEYDSLLTFVRLDKAQELYKSEGYVSGVGVKIDNIRITQRMRNKLRMLLGRDYWVTSWMDLNRNLFSALKLEKTVMFIILALIVLVACFNIVSTLIMVVMEKTKDIGILKSIGASNKSIMAIFTLEGFIIGLAGTGLGAAGGFFLCYLLKTYQFIQLPQDIYYIDTLPVQVEWLDSAIIILASIVISFLSTLYPAYQAARLEPVEALRYE